MSAGITYALGAFAVTTAVIAYSALFGVHQTEQALVLRFGKPIRVIPEPGLNAKWPFIDGAIHIDRRLLDLEAPVQEVIASDQKRLVVDAFVRYRIHDPLKFYQTVNSIEGANSRLSTLTISSLRRVLGESSFIKVVRDERPQLTGRMREQVDREATAMGISVVDIRIRRADLPGQNSQAVYQRMQTERQREAAEFRAVGDQRAQEIRARADRDVTILIAEARSMSERIRGQGDAERNSIFAAAFGQDQDFFTFYRTIQAYERGFASEDTRMLLKPNSDFFQYFGNDGSKREPKQATRLDPE
jgi:modulator of FtsH protease HflC